MSVEILSLTERQQREREYYDQYVSHYNLNHEIDLSPVTSIKGRPWNSYWAVFHVAEKLHRTNARLLDFGSGPGENALRFSKIGYDVEGFDISPGNVGISKAVFKKYNQEKKGNFQVAAAEKLPYPNDYFDVVAGIDILHHVDIARSVNECLRVLKPGGVAVFREPIEVPVLDWIRNRSFIRIFAPNQKSFRLHITEDERKLTQIDINTLKTIFPKVRVKRFFLFARFDKYFRDGNEPHPSFLERLDYFLMRTFPILKKLGGAGLIIMRKSHE